MYLSACLLLTLVFTQLLTHGTAAGIYDLRLLQIKRCRRLGLMPVLALDCCLLIA